jgi:6-phosphofructokinase
MSKKNIIVGQSGGPTAVINSSLYGVVTEGLRNKDKVDRVYGMVNGIEGFLKGNIIDFEKDLSEADIELLTTTPAAYLGSCRYKLPDSIEDPVYPKLFEKFEELNIGYFFYIGGNDSMDTVSKLSRYAKKVDSDISFIGEPKTIDNDLVLTDHTPGFGSAARYVATTVREIILDANVYDTKSITIVEVMGRHAGWLTAASVLARKHVGDNPLLIYLPEVAFDLEKFISQVEAALEKVNNLVVCISEGIKDKDNVFLSEYEAETVEVDKFGHKMLSGSGKYLEKVCKKRLGVKVRSVELNVCQRCSSTMISDTDRKEAIMAGEFGVRAALEGETGKMVSFVRKSDDPYELTCGLEDVNEICNKEKPVPVEWITNDGSDISDDFIRYAKPLIKGTVEVPLGSDGLPKYIYR